MFSCSSCSPPRPSLAISFHPNSSPMPLNEAVDWRVHDWLATQCSQFPTRQQTLSNSCSNRDTHQAQWPSSNKRKCEHLSTSDKHRNTSQRDHNGHCYSGNNYPTPSSPPPTTDQDFNKDSRVDTRSMLSSVPVKRRRRGQDPDDDEGVGGAVDNANSDNDNDNDGDVNNGSQQTPRRMTMTTTNVANNNNIAATSQPSLYYSTSSVSSLSISRNSSPSKQLRGMSLIDDGFVLDKLFVPSPAIPPGLARLVEEIELVGQGVGLLPASARDEVWRSGLRFPDHVFTNEKEAAAPLVSLGTARNISDRANLCELRLEDEASWNMEVHHHLLRRVCRPHGGGGLVDFVSCTTARIAPAYSPRNAPSKMVDFCLHINPAHDTTMDPSAIKDGIDALRRRLPHHTINHTDYAPLCDLPIGPSIETKQSAHDWQKATLQMATWQSAQLRAISALERSTAPAPMSAPDLTAVTYFPGVIVQGHDWHLVATTERAGGTKAFLTKVTIGSTETPLGVYKILAALDCLARWCRDVYWPMYKEKILRIT
ncbi:hypothetical protein F5Y01DRAFT_300902 [Xylaria sp. FL0043]|nr:hypothetical protein F5Y01DRAFT_300902 [Xylaria sp. FL0043]